METAMSSKIQCPHCGFQPTKRNPNIAEDDVGLALAVHLTLWHDDKWAAPGYTEKALTSSDHDEEHDKPNADRPIYRRWA